MKELNPLPTPFAHAAICEKGALAESCKGDSEILQQMNGLPMDSPCFHSRV